MPAAGRSPLAPGEFGPYGAAVHGRAVYRCQAAEDRLAGAVQGVERERPVAVIRVRAPAVETVSSIFDGWTAKTATNSSPVICPAASCLERVA